MDCAEYTERGQVVRSLLDPASDASGENRRLPGAPLSKGTPAPILRRVGDKPGCNRQRKSIGISGDALVTAGVGRRTMNKLEVHPSRS